jgi:hypothetical protein
LTHGFTVSPFATAFRASRPAATITLGLEVLVHDVIAAITTSPWPSVNSLPSTGTRPRPPALAKSLSIGAVAIDGCSSNTSLPPPSLALLNSLSIAWMKLALTSLSATRSCGRFGPASDGSMLESSSLSTSVKIGSGVVLVRYMPCAWA